VVVDTGGVFSTLVDDVAVVPVADGVIGWPVLDGPSAPDDVSGVACPMPCCDGASVFVSGGWVIAGGAFW